MKLYLPFNGRVRLTSRYGNRVLFGQQEWHSGLDLVGIDDITVVAPCDGIVGTATRITDPSNRTSEWGFYCRLDTQDGLMIYMCHMDRLLVSAGQMVKRGQPLGIMGSTGRSTAPHTHFEVRQNGIAVNPCQFLEIPNEAGVYINVEPKEEEEEMTQEKFNQMLTQAFLDLAKEPTDAWASADMKWAQDEGLIKGDQKGNLMGRKPITREEVAVILHRIYNQLK